MGRGEKGGITGGRRRRIRVIREKRREEKRGEERREERREVEERKRG